MVQNNSTKMIKNKYRKNKNSQKGPKKYNLTKGQHTGKLR